MPAIVWTTLAIIGYVLFLRLTGPFVFTNSYAQFLFGLFKVLLPLLSLWYLFSSRGWLPRLRCTPLIWGFLATGLLILSSLLWLSRDAAPTLYRELDRRTIAGYDVFLWVNCGGGTMGHCITELVQQKPLTSWFRVHKRIANLGRFYKTTMEQTGPDSLRVRAVEGIEPPKIGTVAITGPW
jgi:hypothetical protein